MKNPTSKKKLALSFLFLLSGIILLQIPLTLVLGSGTKFTLYDFLAPTLGAFLATPLGLITVLATQLTNVLLHSSRLESVTFIRLFPLLFGVFYFSKKRDVNMLIPVFSIILFNLHPVGRSAWVYSLFWTIPVIAHFFRKNLFLRSLGATFTAHGVGSSLWVWSLGLTKEMWLALIPQTAIERTIMAAGICASYLLISSSLRFALQLKNRQILRYLKLGK